MLFAPERNRNDFEDMRSSPRCSQVERRFPLIRAMTIGGDMSPLSPIDEARGGTPLALTPPIWRDAAEWDFIWLHVRGRDESRDAAGTVPSAGVGRAQ